MLGGSPRWPPPATRSTPPQGPQMCVWLGGGSLSPPARLVGLSPSALAVGADARGWVVCSWTWIGAAVSLADLGQRGCGQEGLLRPRALRVRPRRVWQFAGRPSGLRGSTERPGLPLGPCELWLPWPPPPPDPAAGLPQSPAVPRQRFLSARAWTRLPLTGSVLPPLPGSRGAPSPPAGTCTSCPGEQRVSSLSIRRREKAKTHPERGTLEIQWRPRAATSRSVHLCLWGPERELLFPSGRKIQTFVFREGGEAGRGFSPTLESGTTCPFGAPGPEREGAGTDSGPGHQTGPYFFGNCRWGRDTDEVKEDGHSCVCGAHVSV